MIGVRFRADVGFEGKCDYCRTYWPLAPEFWNPEQGFRMCRACRAVYRAMKQAERRQDPAVRETDRIASNGNRRAKRHADPRGFAQRQREWYHLNRDRILPQKRAQYAERRAALGKPYTPRLETSPVLAALRKRVAA